MSRHCAKPLLLVEDNPDDAMILRRALGELGVAERLIHASSAEDALAFLHSAAGEKPALILLDLHLPGMDGVEFLRTVKSDPSFPPLPVVVLTTSQERRDILQSFDLHAAGYIVKPLDYAATVEALKVIQDYWSLSHLPACHS
jgi:CheY-like chemotaxis protein